jgi:hypothetical protein
MGAAGAQTTTTACGTAPAGYNVIESNARYVIGSTGPDFICAGPGNNIIRAKGKNDIIYGGAGNDVIWAGYGNDLVFGGAGNDVINAGGGRDTVSAAAGNDIVRGGTGPDVIAGGDGDDNLTGGDGHDSIRGNAGADTITGLRGIDSIWGDGGDDSILGGRANDVIQGGEGNDSVNGGAEDDVIGGGNGDDVLRGGEGQDTIVGGNGNDTLNGGGHNDVLRGSNGDDTLDGGNGLNTAIGGNDLDTCRNAASPNTNCEILDGIDSAAPPARVTVSFPTPSGATGPIDVTGTDWSPAGNVAVNFPLIEGTEASTPGGPATVDGNGGFAVLTDTASLDGRLVQIIDSSAGRTKTITPILESYSYDDATLTLTVMGPVGKTFVAHVYNSSAELVDVEQMTFGENGSISKVLDDFEDQVQSIDLRRSDADGDVELHKDAWTRPPA